MCDITKKYVFILEFLIANTHCVSTPNMYLHLFPVTLLCVINLELKNYMQLVNRV